MPECFRIATRIWATALLLSGAATAQGAALTGLAAVPNLGQLTRSSGYIFSGTVTSVGRTVAATPGDVATMRIAFRVEQAVLGVRTGQILTIREWAGLWDAGERYRPGERVMLFLYPPSRLGLTSPVGGWQGRFRIDRNGQILLPPDRMGVLQPAATTAARPASGIAITTKGLVRASRQAGRE